MTGKDSRNISESKSSSSIDLGQVHGLDGLNLEKR